MRLNDLVHIEAGSALWRHCEAISLADLACSGVPHCLPDAERTFDSMVGHTNAGFSDDLVMTLVKADLVNRESVPASSAGVVTVRGEIVKTVRPFVAADPGQWGPRMSSAILSNVPVDDHSNWSSTGSGCVMSAGPLAIADVDDGAIAWLTAATHAHPEGLSAAIAMVNGLRAAAMGVTADEVVAAIVRGARHGEAVAKQTMTGLGLGHTRPRSIADAVASVAAGGDAQQLIDDERDYTSARYVLACGLQAFVVATESGTAEVRTAIETAARSGDPDTSAVVTMGLLQAQRPDVVSQQIDELTRLYHLATFRQVLATPVPPTAREIV